MSEFEGGFMKKCELCELNYVDDNEKLCSICAQAFSKKKDYNISYEYKTAYEYENKINDSINSASKWFLEKYKKEILDNYDLLVNDLGYKQAYIKQIFEKEKRDSDVNGTTTRVNAVIRYLKLKREYIIFLQKLCDDLKNQQ